METVINVDPSDLNSGYADALDRSIEEANNNEVVSMTMEEFMAYTPKKK